MKLYADSADADAVIPLLTDGLVHGVTTNPKIVQRDGLTNDDLGDLYNRLRRAGAGEIFVQATGAEFDELLANAERIAAFGDAIVVKVPATRDGFRVAKTLIVRGQRVLLTAVYSLAQATLAASIGADYVAPYFGRIVDSGEDGLGKVASMNQILAPTKTRVLVASVRSPMAAATLALSGVAHITADVPVILAMMDDPVTEASAREFEAIVNTIGSR